MTEPLIISVSGMRGIIGRNLTAAVALEYCNAFGTFLQAANPGTRLSVCIGMDSRPSGPMLKSAVMAGLTATGVDVIDLGLVTTPCVGISPRELGCAGGVVITASHNPIEYNGIKLLLDNGIAPSPETATKIRQIFLDRNFTHADSIHCGKAISDNQADDRHIAKVLAIINKEAITY